MNKKSIKFLLQRFAEGEGGSAGEGAGQGTQGTTGGQGTGTGEGGQGGQATQPFATFPDEKSFMSRVDREAKKRQAEFLKSLGIEDETSLKTMIESKKQAEENAKSDLQKAQEKASKLEKENGDLLSKTNGILKNAEAKVQALELGVKPERVNYLLKLLELNDVEVKDGVVDTETLKTQINKVLTDFPELKGVVDSTPPVVTSTKGGQEFKGGQNQPLTYDMIKNMSTKEVAARLPEIQQFMKNNPQR